jgi:hypothetical protein
MATYKMWIATYVVYYKMTIHTEFKNWPMYFAGKYLSQKMLKLTEDRVVGKSSQKSNIFPQSTLIISRVLQSTDVIV